MARFWKWLVGAVIVASLVGTATTTIYAGGSTLPACTTGSTGSLQPVLQDLSINQGLEAYTARAATFSVTSGGATTTTNYTASGNLARGKDTLVRAYLTLPSSCSGTITVTGASLTFSNGTDPSTMLSPYTTPSGTLQASAQSNSTADPLFVIPAASLRPGTGGAFFTGTFTLTLTYTQNKLSTPLSQTFSARTAPFEKKTSALRLLVVPMGDSSQTFSSQFPSAATADVQNAMATLSRLYPVQSGIGDLSSTTGGIRYTIDTATMLNLRAIPGAYNTGGFFCGTQAVWPTLQSQLNQYLQTWNAANPNAFADRVVGVVYGGNGSTSSAGSIAAHISDGSYAGCAEGMSDVNSTALWVRAIDDNSSARTVSYTGSALAMEVAHTFGLVPADRSTNHHSINVAADGATVPKAWNVSGRNFIAINHSGMRLDTSTGAWDNSDTVLEQTDYQDLLCFLGGATTTECATASAVGTTGGLAAGPQLIGSGSINESTGQASIAETYYTTGPGATSAPTCPNSIYRIVQSISGGATRNDGLCITDTISAHASPAIFDQTQNKSFTFSIDALTGSDGIQIAEFPVGTTNFSDLSGARVLYSRGRIAAPSITNLSVSDFKTPFTFKAPTIPPKPDIMFLADNTSSMGTEVNNVATNAQTIMDSVLTQRPTAKFGAAHYRDFYCDQNRYGVNKQVSDDSKTFGAAVGEWTPSGGCDLPEAQLYALQRLATTLGGDASADDAGWRSGSSKIIVWFGDAPGHDPVCSPDLGNVTLTSAIAALKAANIRVIALSVGNQGLDYSLQTLLNLANTYPSGGDSPCPQNDSTQQATSIATATDGIAQSGVDPTAIANTIIANLQNLPATLVPSTSCDSGLTLNLGNQVPANPVDSGASVAYPDAAIHVADGVTPGDHRCSVQFSVNGTPDPDMTQTLHVSVGTVTATVQSINPSRLRFDLVYECDGLRYPVAVGVTPTQATATEATFTTNFDGTIACGDPSSGNLVAYANDGFSQSAPATTTPPSGKPAAKGPTAAIYTPAVNTTFLPGATVHLTGAGNSPQTGPLSQDQLSWKLTLGGTTVATPDGNNNLLLPNATGLYTLVLTATDSYGTGTATEDVQIVAPPSIAVTHSPAGPLSSGGTYTFSVTASDPASGLSSVACSVDSQDQTMLDPAGTTATYTATFTIATSGMHSVNCVATSKAGLQATASDQAAILYQFVGFLSPVDNPPTVNTGKAGKTYPAKWQTKDASGNFVSSLGVVNSITYTKDPCSDFTAGADALETTSTGGTLLRYDATANQFVYNWQTPTASASPSCYTLKVALTDGSVHIAYFKLS